VDYCKELKKESTTKPIGVVIVVVPLPNKSSCPQLKFLYIMCNQEHLFVDCLHKIEVCVMIKGKAKPTFIINSDQLTMLQLTW
jgi:hypothetical protein